MTLRKMKCWEIVECNESEHCLVKQFPNIPCWEIEQMYNTDRALQDVCRECKVYLLNEEESVSTDDGNGEILQYGQIMKFVRKCPVYSNNIRNEEDCL